MKFKTTKLKDRNQEHFWWLKKYTNDYKASRVWNTHQNTTYSLQKSQLKLHEYRAVFFCHLGSTCCENLSYKSINQLIGMKAQKREVIFYSLLDWHWSRTRKRKPWEKIKMSRDTTDAKWEGNFQIIKNQGHNMPGLTSNLWCENYHKNGKKLKQEIFLKGQSNNTDEKRFFKKRSTARTSTKLS